MKKLAGWVTVLFLVLAASSVWAASGYKIVMENDGSVTGLLIYYHDSVDSDVPQLNDFINRMITQSSSQIYMNQATSADDVIQTAIRVMQQGSQVEGWDACLGLVVYEINQDGLQNIKMDLYVLGMEQNGQVVPYFYVGSFCLNKMAWQALSSSL